MKLWTALVTPFCDDLTIDCQTLVALIERQDHFILLGSTGESLSLSNEERVQVLRLSLDAHPQKKPLVGVPSDNFERARAWVEFCNAQPLGGYLMPTPLYTKPGFYGQKFWFSTLMKEAKHPVMLYNIPGRAGVSLHADILQTLNPGQLLGVKDSGGSLESFLAYKKAAPAVDIYCGDDGMFKAFAAHGAAGLVSVASNIWPCEMERYVAGTQENEVLWQQRFDILSQGVNPLPVKAWMAAKGLLKNAHVRPPLSEKDFLLPPFAKRLS